MKSRLIYENEKDKFNSFGEYHPKGHILQSYEWGEVKKSWEPLRLVIEDDNDKIIASIMLLKRKLPIINKTFFYASRGPVLDIHDEKVFDFLLAEVKKLAKEHDAIFLKIDPDVSNKDEALKNYLDSRGFLSLSKGGGFEGVQPRAVFRLDIKPTQEELLANFKPKTRYNLRYASKKGVEIVEGKFKDLKEFYEVLDETAERDRFGIRPYQYYVDMWNALYPSGYLKLFLAYAPTEEGRKMIAGTIAFIYGQKAWYIYGASGNKYRNLMPNYLLQWTMIQWAKESGCTLYDFRGVPGEPTEDNPLYGLYRFKVGFGGEYVKFVGEYDLVYSKFWYSVWQMAEKTHSKVFKKLLKLKKKLKGSS